LREKITIKREHQVPVGAAIENQQGMGKSKKKPQQDEKQMIKLRVRQTFTEFVIKTCLLPGEFEAVAFACLLGER